MLTTVKSVLDVRFNEDLIMSGKSSLYFSCDAILAVSCVLTLKPTQTYNEFTVAIQQTSVSGS